MIDPLSLCFPGSYLLNKLKQNYKIRLIVLGSEASGKTTLWKRLKEEKFDSMSYNPTVEYKIEKFKVEIDDDSTVIESTKDIGGGDNCVCSYDTLIKGHGTVIYYLVDFTNLKCREVRARLLKISKIVEQKEYKGCCCKIIATHYDKFEENKALNQENAAGKVKQLLDIRSITGMTLDIADTVLAVNLNNDDDISRIKKDVMKIQEKTIDRLINEGKTFLDDLFK
jgi:septin family protein